MPSSRTKMQEVKLTFVGDRSIGKTCLFWTYQNQRFPKGHVHSYFDPLPRISPVTVGHKTYALTIWETSGGTPYDHIRPLQYPGTDVFVVCYDVASPLSFQTVRSKWIPEIRRHCASTPFLLVGCKVDLRASEFVEEKLGLQGLETVSESEGEAMATEFGAVEYIDCSARTQYQLGDVFEHACTVAEEGWKIQRQQAILERVRRTQRPTNNSGIRCVIL